MCKFKSAIILKDRVFIPDYDSHTDMLNELGIEDNRANAERLFVRAELYPKNDDVFSDIDGWTFKVDQDIRPDWFVEEYEKSRMITAVKEWAKEHIHIGIDGLKIDSGKNHYIKDCKNVVVCDNASISNVCGNASISEVYGNASISKVCDNASISYVRDSASISEVCDNASISYVCDSASISKVCDNASISKVCDNASISKVCDNASISDVYDNASISDVYDNASISEVYGSASISKAKGQAIIANSPYSTWNKQSGLILSENATFKDNKAKVIYQSGGWELRSV